MINDKFHDKHEKSKIEIIGLNKGISRKIEENTHLKSEHQSLQIDLEQQRTKCIEQEAQLKRLKDAQTKLEKILAKEDSLSEVVRQLLEAEMVERERQARISNQLNRLAEILEIKSHIPIEDNAQTAATLKEEVSRLNDIITQNENAENEKNHCNICQEKVILHYIVVVVYISY